MTIPNEICRARAPTVTEPKGWAKHNDRCLVARIPPDGTRQRARLLSGFLSHYLIDDRTALKKQCAAAAVERGTSGTTAGQGKCATSAPAAITV